VKATLTPVATTPIKHVINVVKDDLIQRVQNQHLQGRAANVAMFVTTMITVASNTIVLFLCGAIFATTTIAVTPNAIASTPDKVIAALAADMLFPNTARFIRRTRFFPSKAVRVRTDAIMFVSNRALVVANAAMPDSSPCGDLVPDGRRTPIRS